MKPSDCKSSLATLMVCGLIVISASSLCAQKKDLGTAWKVLETGLAEKSADQRVAAVRVLGLLADDTHAAVLTEKALKDRSGSVRAAAATTLGQMHVAGTDAALKQALNDKQLLVVMAAAHALQLLNDPVCYDVYYEVFTGERKNNTGMVAQEMKVLRDPKQVGAIGLRKGIGFVPYASIGWEAIRTIRKDRKEGAAEKAALLSALATDPEPRADDVLLAATQNQNWVVRVAALEAIAKRGNPALLPDIAPNLDDPKGEVRYTAAATVIHLNDLPKGDPGSTKVVQTAPSKPREPQIISVVAAIAK